MLHHFITFENVRSCSDNFHIVKLLQDVTLHPWCSQAESSIFMELSTIMAGGGGGGV